MISKLKKRLKKDRFLENILTPIHGLVPFAVLLETNSIEKTHLQNKEEILILIYYYLFVDLVLNHAFFVL